MGQRRERVAFLGVTICGILVGSSWGWYILHPGLTPVLFALLGFAGSCWFLHYRWNPR